MATQKKIYKGVLSFRYEPTNLDLVLEDPYFIELFTKAGCIQFCQKLQGRHQQVSQDFVINFKGKYKNFGCIHIPISPDSISKETRIPRTGEEWFKATKFNLKVCDDYLKPEHVGINMTEGIPITCLRDEYSKLLIVI